MAKISRFDVKKRCKNVQIGFFLNNIGFSPWAVEFLCYLSGEEVIPHLTQLLTHEHKSMRWIGEESIKFLKKEPYDEKFQTSPISPAEQGVYEELRRQYEDQLE